MKTILNIGSGKSYMPDAFNIDINPQWKSDLILDISKPLNDALPNNHFDKIIAHDVLEHVSDLVLTMNNCLALLKEGGVMDINVPYDLSYGAWQDPTHVRAFNERSWWYYWEWAWYLGWKEYGLKTIELQYGIAEGADVSKGVFELLRVPRAIECMKVVLQKTRLPT